MLLWSAPIFKYKANKCWKVLYFLPGLGWTFSTLSLKWGGMEFFFFYFFQHMLRINPGNTWKVLGCCDGLISWHRGTAHGLAPQGVTEWLLVTNMEKFQVPLHGCKQAVNLPWQVSKEKTENRDFCKWHTDFGGGFESQKNVKITLAVPEGDRGGDIQPRMQRNEEFLSAGLGKRKEKWEKEAKTEM